MHKTFSKSFVGTE